VSVADDRWDLSGARASEVRLLMEWAGLKKERVARVTGHADRELVTSDPFAPANNRVEIILLRE
jgi:chemotaxis protein MotB